MRAFRAATMGSVVMGATLAGCLLTAPPRSAFQTGGSGGAATTMPDSGGAGGAGGAGAPAIAKTWPATSDTAFDWSKPPAPGDLLVLGVLVDSDVKPCPLNFDDQGYTRGPDTPEHDNNTMMSLDLTVVTRSAAAGMPPPSIADQCPPNSKWVAILVALHPGRLSEFPKPQSGSATAASIDLPDAHAPDWLPLLFVGTNDLNQLSCTGWRPPLEEPHVGGNMMIDLALLVPENRGDPHTPSCQTDKPGWIAVLAPIRPD
jgi:hypothetical protein